MPKSRRRVSVLTMGPPYEICKKVFGFRGSGRGFPGFRVELNRCAVGIIAVAPPTPVLVRPAWSSLARGLRKPPRTPSYSNSV